MTLCAVLMVVMTAASLPVAFSSLAVLLMMPASRAFLLSPAVLESQIAHRHFSGPARDSSGEVVTHWFDNPT